MSFTKFPVPTREIDADNLLFRSDVRQNQLLVGSVSDLPAPDGNGIITLPDNTMIEPDGLVDLGTYQLKLGVNTSIIGRDPGRDGFSTSRPADYAIVGEDGGGQRILRTFFVINNGGYAFSLTTTQDVHINIFYVGVLGDTGFGYISGGRVVALKSCYQGQMVIPGVGTFTPFEGIVIDGDIEKLLVGDTPFEDMETGFNAITIKSTAVLAATDIRGNYFKGTAGTAIVVEAGASVDVGIVSANVVDLGISSYTGIDSTTPNWTFTGNTNMRDSYMIGKMRFGGGTAITTITTQSTPVKISTTTVASSMNERFTHTNNRLTSIGSDDAVVSIHATFYLTSAGNNENITVYIAKNGTVLPSDSSTVFVGTGGDRTVGTVIGVETISNGDYIEAFVSNESSTNDITFYELNVMIQG